MSAKEVIRVYGSLESIHSIWVEGGWGVEAIGTDLSWEHGDLDLVADSETLEEAQAKLKLIGYQLTDTGSLPSKANFKDSAGHKVTIHLLQFKKDGSAERYLPPNKWMSEGKTIIYTPDYFKGDGLIDGQHFRCISAPGLLMRYKMYTPRPGHNDEAVVQELTKLLASAGTLH